MEFSSNKVNARSEVFFCLSHLEPKSFLKTLALILLLFFKLTNTQIDLEHLYATIDYTLLFKESIFSTHKPYDAVESTVSLNGQTVRRQCRAALESRDFEEPNCEVRCLEFVYP